MADRFRRALAALLLLILLWAAQGQGESLQGWGPSGWATISSANFWRVLLPLGDTPDADQVPQAFQWAEQLGGMFSKMLLRRTMDPDLAEALGIILRRSQNLDLRGIYAHQPLPWQEGPGGQRFFTYWGWVEGKDYRLSLIARHPSLRAPGDMMSRLALGPLGPPSTSKRGFLLRLEHDLHTGPLGIEEELAMGEALIGLLDGGHQSSPANGQEGEAGPEDLYLKRLFKESFPHLTSLLGRYLEIVDVTRVCRDPLLGKPVTQVDLVVQGRKEILRRDYPHFYRAYEKLILSSAYALRVKDPSGHLLGEAVREGGQLSVRFLTRRGLLYPADDRWRVADPRGLPIHRFLQLPHFVELSSWMRVLRMKVGIQRFHLRSTYRDGIFAWSLSEVPQLILPWGVRQLFSPFLRPFLEYLRYGENGQGLTFQLAFRSTEEGYIHQTRLSVPLRDSPLLSFLLKLGGDLGYSLSPQARQELYQLFAEMAQALSQDYQQARANLLPG